MTSTYGGLLARFSRGVTILRSVLPQIAAHRKVLEHTISRIKLWVEAVAETSRDEECTEDEVRAGGAIIAAMAAIKSTMSEYSMQSWVEPTLSNSVHAFMRAIQVQLRIVRDNAGVFGGDLVELLEVGEDLWVVLHGADLRAIKASFSQFLESDRKTPESVERIKERMTEIDEYLGQHPECGERDLGQVYSAVAEEFQRWFVDLKDFQILEEIGYGMTAYVFKGVDKRNGRLVAIKQFKEEELYGPGLQFFQREVSVLAKCAESNAGTILKLVGVTNTNPLCIITEFMPNGGLNALLRDPKRKVSPLFKTICAYDIARGMAYLHSRKIVHRDLKSLNILLDSKMHVKICDFGFARFCNQEDPPVKPGNLGTVHWMAPEVIERKGSFDFSVDVYAYGVVLCELVTQTRPFNRMKGDQIKAYVVKGGRPELPFDVNPKLKQLIEECWDANPEKRPTFSDIVERFQSLSVVFDGTNTALFSKYMRDVSEEENEFDAADMRITHLLNGQMSLKDAIAEIELSGIPDSKVHATWEVIPYLVKTCSDRYNLAKLIAFFFDTPKFKDSLEHLRAFPPKTVPEYITVKLLNYLPSDDPEVEMTIAVICCRNGGADAALLKLTDPTTISLALESCARTGITTVTKEEVVAKCVSLLSSVDSEWLAAGALKVLLTLKAFAAFSQFPIHQYLNSPNPTVAKLATALIVGAGLSKLPVEPTLIDILLSRHPADCESSTAIIALCHNPSNAEYILTHTTTELTDTNLKIWMVSCFHESLKPALQSAIAPLTETTPALAALRRSLGL